MLASLLRDERGDWSTARCGLWAVILFTFWYIAATAKPDAGVLSWSGTMGVMFGGWAAGSKFATAWGSLGSVGQGIASAKGFVANEWENGDPRAGDL